MRAFLPSFVFSRRPTIFARHKQLIAMAKNLVTNAEVNLSINGSQAVARLDELRKKAEGLRKEIDGVVDGGAKGDDPRLKELRKQLNETEREIRKCRTEVGLVNDVMRQLDKASPNELRACLRQLNRELNSMERGGAAWNAQVERIRLVRAELDNVNASIRGVSGESGWAGFVNRLDGWKTAALGAVGTLTGLTVAAREAVDRFAEMDQEMANVRKYTGMTEAEVASLNEAFKQMDTRSGRDQLNRLAQDAGRLGKTSEEDVLGFVRAADKINVALEDLGDGATLTLSKLTGIFGDEERLGTEKALLSVGSVINELSQNCSASAPYLAQFASRMGGVASQAGMTVQQVMAFGAVLDTTNQGVEAASTAVSQVITRLFQDTAKYARVAGLDLKDFSQLLRTDANAAFIQFLEALNKAGGMDVLSPMFADMGENGSRAIAALSSLAGHIDEVKAQQEAANVAFAEATSIDREFAVQNGTLQAQMEKRKKALAEITIELGQRLAPAWNFALNSATLFMKAMATVVEFAFKHRTAIITLTAAIASYTAATKVATNWTNILTAAKAAATTGAGKLKTALVALKAINPVGLAITAVTALVTYLLMAKSGTDEYRKAMDEAAKSATSFAEESAKEVREIDKLFGALEGAEKGTKAYNDAKNTIISKYGVYLTGLINEKGEIINLAAAYDRLTWAANKSAQARGIAAAKESLNAEYYKSVDESTEKVRTRLRDLGMEEKQLSRIVAQISAAMAAGRDVPKEIRQEILMFEKENKHWYDFSEFKDSAIGEVHKLRDRQTDFKQRTEKLDAMDTRHFAGVSDGDLSKQIESLSKALSETPTPVREVQIETTLSLQNKDVAEKVTTAIGSVRSDKQGTMTMQRGQAETLLRELIYEKQQRPATAEAPKADPDAFKTYTSSKQQEKEDRKKAAEARKEAVKARKEFKEGLDAIKAQYLDADNEIVLQYATSQIEYSTYLKQRSDAEQEFYNNSLDYYAEHIGRIKDIDVEEDKDYQTLLKKRQDALEKYEKKHVEYELKRIKTKGANAVSALEVSRPDSDSASLVAEEAFLEKRSRLRLQTLREEQALFRKGSKEWEDYQLKIETETQEGRLAIEKIFAEKVAAVRKEYAQKTAAEKYSLDLTVLQQLLDAEKISAEEFYKYRKKLQEKYGKELPGGNFEKSPDTVRNMRDREKERQTKEIDDAVASGMITEEEGKLRKKALGDDYFKEVIAGLKNCGNEWVSVLADMGDAWRDLWASLEGSGGDVLGKIAKAAEATFAVVTAGMQMASQFAQANAEIEVKKIEKRYDREIELAQGNTRLVSKLEKEKEQKTAEAKNKASRASYAMQTVQAIATAVTGSMNAYSSTAAIPIVGPALAPAAAAVALAMGMANVALIRKQQQAAEAQGYAEGGFTPKGGKYDVAGVVHAGEWVASQELLRDPSAMAVVSRLEEAQRSRRSFADMMAESAVVSSAGLLRPHFPAIPAAGKTAATDNRAAETRNSRLETVIERLAARLDEPFVTVNTVTGDSGIRKAQEDYERMMRNKNRKR